jgi:DNA-binding CsgD family transcriptional regulator
VTAAEGEAALLERGEELEEVGDALARAAAGRGSAAIVSGAAGIGKTSLLAAAAEAAAELGFVTLAARASELEHDFAYGCARQLLEPVAARAGEERRARLFEGPAAPAAALFAAAAGEAELPSAAMLHALYWLLGNLAEEGPLALLVDDLHWADGDSLRLLAYLAPRLDALPLVVLGAVRSDEGAGQGVELARFATAPEVVTIELATLSAGAVATICERELGAPPAPELAAACAEASGGNPFYLRALLRAAAEEGLAGDPGGAARVRGLGPAAVAQAVLLRLSGEAPAATAVVRALAVLGEGAGMAELAALAGLEEAEAAAAADVLERLGLLRSAPALGFAHPIVREAIYADFGAQERRRWHHRAAALLAERGAAAERIAAQVVAAAPNGDPKRVELLRGVASAALARGAPGAAAAYLRRALAEPPPAAERAELLLELGLAEHRVAAPEAAAHLAAAVAEIEAPELLAEAVRHLANALTVGGESDRAVEALAAAIARVEGASPELALLLEAELASHALQASPAVAEPARRRLRRFGDLGGATAPERSLLMTVAFQRAREQTRASEAAALLEPVVRDWQPQEGAIDMVGPFYDVVVGLLATERLDAVAAPIDRALASARVRASIPATAYLTCRRGWLSLRRGDVGAAEDDAHGALALLGGAGIPLGIPFATALLVEALLARDELEEAQRAMAQSGVEIAAIAPGPTNNFFLEASAAALIAAGCQLEGVELLRELGRRDELAGGANPLASRWRSRAALALAEAGEGEEARALAAADVTRAREWGADGGIGIALRAIALTGADPDQLARLREAVAHGADSPGRLEQARSLLELGAALRRANHRAAAREPLEQSLALAERLGARALVERARTELLAAGGRSSDPYGSGVEQLTAAERRVAELALAGRSNPEIAEALFVTRKTVETHLGRVYRKLDIGGRGELAAALS